jgi:hypothetical protein
VLSKADERLLRLYERRVLRCIFGAVQDKCTWRRIHNHELYKQFNVPDVTEYIKIYRLSWAGQSRRCLGTRPEGTRKIGRPRLRWEDGVIQDIESPGPKNCGNVAVNREGWLELLKKAKVHTGLSSQWS